jgi:hypothetical protein
MGVITFKKPTFKVVGDILIPESDVKADYRFIAGGGSKLHDYSLYRNHGIINNTNWAIGRQGSALSFNGTSSYVNIDPLINHIDPEKGSALVWFKVDNASNWNDNKNKVLTQLKCTDVSGDTIVIWKSSTNNITWQYRGQNTSIKIELNCSSWTDTIWHFAVITWDTNKDELKAYWDGQLYNTKPGLKIQQVSLDKGRIGSRYLDDFNWHGLIDSVKWLSRILLPDEVLGLYEEGK